MDPVQDGTNWYVYCSNNPLANIDPTGMINMREIIVSLLNPIGAFIVKNNADKALQYASKHAEDLGGKSSIHNGAADAFRHAYWNALNARDVGATVAKDFGDAHEADQYQPDAERKMDLHNNAVGRNIGVNNPKANDLEIVKLVKAALSKGELITDCTPTDNSYTYGTGVNDYTHLPQPNLPPSVPSPIPTPSAISTLSPTPTPNKEKE